MTGCRRAAQSLRNWAELPPNVLKYTATVQLTAVVVVRPCGDGLTGAMLEVLVGPGTAGFVNEPGVDDWHSLQGALATLVRGDLSQLNSCLVVHGSQSVIGGTKANFRCHFIRSDANDTPRVKALAEQLALEVLFHCIPRSDVVNMRALEDENDQMRESIRLAKQAAALFTTKQPSSGEGGELLLYALLEQGLGVPQILSKMSLKTNREMQVHGTDGVHAKILDSGNLALYWGEAKIWDSLSSAITDCFDSISPYLLGEAVDQDTWLIKHYADLGDDELTARVLDYFDNSNPKSANVEVRGACLIGFSHAGYPVLPKNAAKLQVQLDAAVIKWQSSVSNKIVKSKIESYELEVFFLPVPSADDFRKAIMKAIR